VHNSLIAGHVDYIWGYPEACLFEDCEIRSRAGGYLIQARVPSVSNKGFVFLNCKLTAESGVKDGSMYLARSGGSTEYFDNVVFVNCTMGPVIAPTGWHTDKAPNPSTPTATSGWREYGSVDASGKAVTGHNASGKVLTAAEAEPYSTRQSVLGW
jgi:pectin methylesterase-like acyl-CoA thioesterase